MSQGVSITINKRIEGAREAYAEAQSVQESIDKVIEADKKIEAKKSEFVLMLGSSLALLNMFSLIRYTADNLNDLLHGKLSWDLLLNLAFDVIYMFKRFWAAVDAYYVLVGLSVGMDQLELQQFVATSMYTGTDYVAMEKWLGGFVE